MASWVRGCLLIILLALCKDAPAVAQLPFYTDDPNVTERRRVHMEFFDEIDALQSAQFPNLRQNTANFKINYGLPHNLELDLDAPYLAIYRAPGTQSSTGVGDTDLGIKWNFHKASADSRLPALGASLYIEFPTGNTHNQLGSGLTDYWLNFIVQKPFSEKTRLNGNVGLLFAGNTSTGVIGIQTTRGHVLTGGVSLLHDFNSRWTLGAEAYGGVADNDQLGRGQLQGMIGGQFNVRSGLTFTFGLIGGKYAASPQIGGQVGFALDFPDLWRKPPNL